MLITQECGRSGPGVLPEKLKGGPLLSEEQSEDIKYTEVKYAEARGSDSIPVVEGWGCKPLNFPACVNAWAYSRPADNPLAARRGTRTARPPDVPRLPGVCPCLASGS